MALTDYTSYATIRGILGVGSKEITDAVLSLPLYEQQFVLEMDAVDADGGAVLAQFDTIALISPTARTALQTRFYNIVCLIAGFSVARQLILLAPMFAPKLIGDGKARVQRVDDAYLSLQVGVSGGYNALWLKLTQVLLQLVPTATVPSTVVPKRISSVGLGTDPVTNV